MNAMLCFFIKIGHLKEAKRSGWLAHGIKNPDTTADHIFRAAILGWVLNKQKKLDGAKIIKTLLVHDLSEIYTGDKTPYYHLLPQELIEKRERRKIREILKNPPPFSFIEEKKRAAQVYQEKLEGLKKLIAKLPSSIKAEIEKLWVDCATQKTEIGDFSWQVAKTESFLQALEYWKKEGKIQEELWSRWTKKILKDSVVFKLKKTINNAFLNAGRKTKKDANTQILRFLIEVGKLKRLKRRGWILRKVKDAETVAQHTFQMTIMSWLLGAIKGLDTDRVIKIALSHDLCEVYAGDQTPYDLMLVSGKEDVQKIFNKVPRIPQALRLEWLLRKRGDEWKGIVKLTLHLPKALQAEIINLWTEFQEGLTREGRFVSQVDKLVNLFQAIEYWKKDRSFPVIPWWVDIKERIDDPLLLKFMNELDKEFAEALKPSSRTPLKTNAQK